MALSKLYKLRIFFNVLWLSMGTLSWGATLSAQNDTWIADNQAYLKMGVDADGLYQVTGQDLIDAGFPASQLNSDQLRLVHRGEPQPLWIQDGGDGRLDGNDFFVFFGRRNTDVLDHPLFSEGVSPRRSPVSLTTDSTFYFLSAGGNTPTRRYRFRNYDAGASAREIRTAQFQSLLPLKDPASSSTRLYIIPYRESLNEISSTYYRQGEGWYGDRIIDGQSIVYDVDLEAPFSGSGRLRTRVVGISNQLDSMGFSPRFNHFPVVEARDNSNNWVTLVDDAFLGPVYRDYESNLDSRFNGLNRIQVRYRNQAAPFLPFSVIRAGDVEVLYEGQLNAQDQFELQFQLNSDPSPAQLVIDQVSGANATPWLVAPEEGVIYRPNRSDSTLTFTLNPSPAQRTFRLVDAQNLSQEVGLYPYQSIPDINQMVSSETNFLIITHPVLRASAASYEQYCNSRGFRTAVVEAPDLFNRYYFGQPHPEAISRFANELYVGQGIQPDYVLLLGKGYATDNLQGFASGVTNWVPTYGAPPSDWMLFRTLNGGSVVPPMAVGRIPAATNEEVRAYLDKLRRYEQQGESGWKKNVLHITGGRNREESDQLRSNLDQIAFLLEDPFYGADVQSFRNFSTDLNDRNAEEQILSRVNGDGVGQITYFGHGAATRFEVSIGDDDVPGKYDNADRLLHFYVSGCVLGNVYQRSRALAEEYMFTPDVGAVSWISGTSFGFTSNLRELNRSYYRHISRSSYGQSLGNILVNASREYENFGNFSNEMTILQNAYIGDPAVRLFDARFPDYAFFPDSFQVGPVGVTTQSDSFTLAFSLRNKGKALERDTLLIEVAHTSLSGFQATYTDTVLAPFFSRGYQITRAAANPDLQGLNRFVCSVSRISGGAEGDLGNNEQSFEYFFNATGATPLYPLEYGIGGQTASAALKAQANNISSQTPTALFELDTTPRFNSPVRRQSGAIQRLDARGLYVWNAPLLGLDSTTYHWRVRAIEQGDTSEWRSSSFTAIQGSNPGFAQNDAPQKATIRSSNLLVDDRGRFRFLRSSGEVQYRMATAGVDNARTSAFQRIRMPINDFFPVSRVYQTENRVTGLNFLAVDPDNLIRYSYPSQFNDPNFDQPINESEPPEGEYTGSFYFDYVNEDSTINQQVVDSMLFYLNSIPRGHDVLIFSEEYHRLQDIPQVARILNGWVESSTDLGNLANDLVFLMVGRVGVPEAPSNVLLTAETTDAVVSHTHAIAPLTTSGNIESIAIGPATRWGRASLHFGNRGNGQDSFSVDIIGINKEGEETTLESDLSQNRIELSRIDADLFPRLRLSAYLEDTVRNSPPQLDNWVVTYQGVPEGSWRPDLQFSFSADTLQEGQDFNFAMAFGNISDLPMDSMEVRMGLYNPQGRPVLERSRRVDSLLVNDTFQVRFNQSTVGLNGAYSFRAVVRPLTEPGEQYLFNNQFSRGFFVEGDNENPLLDVYVNGRKIFNNEIVPPRPVVDIYLDDENPYLKIDRSDVFEVGLQRPGASSFELLTPERPDVSFTPADTDRKALLQWQPEENLPNGVYRLRARGRDASGNVAQKTDDEAPYEVAFEVINESTITNFYPYPNPFSDQTRFVFTLTGAQTPDFIKIQIITVSGRVVREIQGNELGPLHIGTNITEYAWDGTDQFGNELANGVYFYRVFVYLDGEQIELRETAGDRFFERGIGKIYIAR